MSSDRANQNLTDMNKNEFWFGFKDGNYAESVIARYVHCVPSL